jgi:hypothetical protein
VSFIEEEGKMLLLAALGSDRRNATANHLTSARHREPLKSSGDLLLEGMTPDATWAHTTTRLKKNRNLDL